MSSYGAAAGPAQYAGFGGAAAGAGNFHAAYGSASNATGAGISDGMSQDQADPLGKATGSIKPPPLFTPKMDLLRPQEASMSFFIPGSYPEETQILISIWVLMGGIDGHLWPEHVLGIALLDNMYCGLQYNTSPQAGSTQPAHGGNQLVLCSSTSNIALSLSRGCFRLACRCVNVSEQESCKAVAFSLSRSHMTVNPVSKEGGASHSLHSTG